MGNANDSMLQPSSGLPGKPPSSEILLCLAELATAFGGDRGGFTAPAVALWAKELARYPLRAVRAAVRWVIRDSGLEFPPSLPAFLARVQEEGRAHPPHPGPHFDGVPCSGCAEYLRDHPDW